MNSCAHMLVPSYCMVGGLFNQVLGRFEVQPSTTAFDLEAMLTSVCLVPHAMIRMYMPDIPRPCL